MISRDDIVVFRENLADLIFEDIADSRELVDEIDYPVLDSERCLILARRSSYDVNGLKDGDIEFKITIESNFVPLAKKAEEKYVVLDLLSNKKILETADKAEAILFATNASREANKNILIVNLVTGDIVDKSLYQ